MVSRSVRSRSRATPRSLAQVAGPHGLRHLGEGGQDLLAGTLGTLDRIAAWLTISGFVNADPGFPGPTRVLNPCSDLLLPLFGPNVGSHARTAIGASALPLNFPVIIAAEIEIIT